MSRGYGAVQMWVLRHLAGQRRWDANCLVSELPHQFARECHDKPDYATATRAERETVYRAVRGLRDKGLVDTWHRETTMWSRGNGWGKEVDLERLWVRLTVPGYVASKRGAAADQVRTSGSSKAV